MLTAVLSGAQVFMIVCILWFLVYSQSYRCGESVHRGQAQQGEVLVSGRSLRGMLRSQKAVMLLKEIIFVFQEILCASNRSVN